MTILERKEQLKIDEFLSYVRTGGKIAIGPQRVSHRQLAEENNLVIQMVGDEPAVDDGGIVGLFPDHIEIAPYKTTSTIMLGLRGLDDEAYDRTFREIRILTASTIANITKLPVKVDFRFEPSQTINPT